MAAELHINGLPLPRELVDALEDGRWQRSVDSITFQCVFGDEPTDPSLYNIDDMQRENRTWVQQHDPVYLGRPSDEHPPGDIDPERSVLIGDLGPDMPFALDYRSNDATPRVVYLDLEGRWREVAPDIGQLLAALGIGRNS